MSRASSAGRKPATRAIVLVGSLLCVAACQAAPASNVNYQGAAPVGSWQLGAGGPVNLNGAGTGGTLPTAGTSGGGNAGSGGVAGSGAVAGTGGVAGIGGVAGTDGFAGIGGVAGTTATAGTGGGGAPLGSMTFDVLTHSQNGEYAPRNVGAIWIETATGQFVKTLEVWAFIRASHLTKWRAEAQSNQVDAVASATLSQHKTHHVTWNMTDASGNAVAAGAYKIIIEVTDHNGSGQFQSVDFNVGAGAMTLMPPDATYYTGMQLVLQ